MKNKAKYVIYTFVIVTAIVAIVVLNHNADKEIIQGMVECRSYRASSKIAGRIDTLFVSEGEWVDIGELLYTISTPELNAKLEQVKALRAAAEAINREVDMGARWQQIEAAKGLWQRAKAGEELAAKSFARVENLYNKGVVPRQQYDEAQANLVAMRAATIAAKAEYDLAVDGATREQKEAVAAKVQEANAAVDEVASYLHDARVVAPISGRISSIISEAGELISVGYPVITILDLNNCWVSFNIREEFIHKISYGKTFRAFIPAINSYVDFEVYYIAAEANFATWSATRARGGFDIRTFEVRAKPLDDGLQILPGMSVIYEI